MSSANRPPRLRSDVFSGRSARRERSRSARPPWALSEEPHPAAALSCRACRPPSPGQSHWPCCPPATAPSRRSQPSFRLVPTSRRTRSTPAVAWLCRSHDATGRQGSSKGFSLLHGWLPAYPETTGYVIGTLLAYGARRGGRADLVQRAREMGDWEREIQEPDGGVMEGTIGTAPQPLGGVQHRHGPARLDRPARVRHRRLRRGGGAGSGLSDGPPTGGRDVGSRGRVLGPPAHLQLTGRVGDAPLGAPGRR